MPWKTKKNKLNQKKEEKTSSPFENVKEDDLKSALEKAISKHEKANILITGSKALGDQKSGLGLTISQELQRSFESDVTVSFIDFNGTSTQLIEEGLISNYQDAKPDVLILEALTLTDNGKVVVEDNHENLSTIIQELKSINEDLYVVLMPSHPIPNGPIYST
ncbi:hypothetical protein [Bacillus sp. E214]|uniref:hypothetical protein n=1 Tax=Bacillus sp. E214 TaxID=2587156 RepID=UPI0011DF18A2|nr:hypothetical protein [Bacillus sp. E214]